MELGETRYQLQPLPKRKGEQPRYRFTTHTEPTGLAALLLKQIIDEESIWSWQNGELRPLQYRFQQQGKRIKRRTRSFDWENTTVNLEEGEVQQQLTGLQPGTVDEALFLVALMHDLQQQRQPFRYAIAKPKGGWHHYQFSRGPATEIEVAAGRFHTWQIDRMGGEEERFRLWMAPELGYLPVQIEFQEPGKQRFLLKLQSVEWQRGPVVE